MKKNILTFIWCIIYLVISTRFFNYFFWTTLFPQRHVIHFFYIVIIIYGLICSFGNVNNLYIGGKNTRVLIILPLVAEIFKVVLTGSFVFSEIGGTLALCAGLSIFFILIKHNINTKIVIPTIICYAFIGFIIQYGENFLGFPTLFGVDDIDSELGSRYDSVFNILQIKVLEYLFPVFCIYFFLDKFIEKKKWLYILPILIFMVFLYILQNRQTMIAVLITFTITPLLGNKQKHIKYSTIACFFLVIFIYFYSDVLFGHIIDSTQNNTLSWDIRMAEIPFYLKRSTENPIAILVGHGNQAYPFFVDGMEFWTSDVGFIGQLFQYGIVFVMQYFILLKSAYTNRNRLPLFSKLYIFSSALHSLFIAPYYTALTAFLWSVMLYYTNNELVKNKTHE